MKIQLTESQIKKIFKVHLREDSSCDIFTNTTRRPDYDDVLNDITPRILKDLTGTIVKMSPDEYFQKCAQLQRTTVEEQYSYIDQRRVDSLIKKITSNIKVDIPMIDFVNNFQEGRHRAYVAKKLGCEQINVVVFTKSTRRPSDDDQEFTINDGKWNDVFTDNEGTFVNYDYTNPEQMNQFYALFDSPMYGLTDVIYDIMKGSKSWSKSIEPGPIVDINRIRFDKTPEKLIDFMIDVLSQNISEEEYYEYNDNEGETLEMSLKYRDFDYLLYDVIDRWSEMKPNIEQLKNYIISMITGMYEYFKYMEDYHSLDYELYKGYTIQFGEGVIKLYVADFKTFTGSVDTHENFKDVLEDENEFISEYTYQYIENYIDDNDRRELFVRDIDEYLSKYRF
jgi:hypothetical protein